jgi:hypothetical protein
LEQEIAAVSSLTSNTTVKQIRDTPLAKSEAAQTRASRAPVPIQMRKFPQKWESSHKKGKVPFRNTHQLK